MTTSGHHPNYTTLTDTTSERAQVRRTGWASRHRGAASEGTAEPLEYERIQLTSDGHRAYLEAVEGAFGGDVDYAQFIKLYGNAPESMKGRYSPAECTGARKERVEGNPDWKHVSTSYAERQNLTMRMHMRRFTGSPMRSQRRWRTRSFRRAPLDVLQLRPHSFDAAGNASDGGGRC